jgi:hypothetical protein
MVARATVAGMAGAMAVAGVTDKPASKWREAWRPLLFLLVVAIGAAGSVAFAVGEGLTREIGGGAIGVSLVLIPGVFHIAFLASGFSAASRARNRKQGPFDGSNTRYFDANHDQGFDLDSARHRNDDRFGL